MHTETAKGETGKNLGGRPPKPEGERLGVISLRLPPVMVEALDAIRAERIDGADRSSIIRELLAEAIAARKGRRQ